MRSDCGVDLVPGFLGREDARRLHGELVDCLSWEQRAIVLFGRPILQPRLIAWGGLLPYRYSGQTLEPRPMIPALAAILARVSERAGVDFNHVLVNRYRDGRDSMGWHADDEPELGSSPPIATLSLGATRRFLLKPRRGGAKAERSVFELESGSLLVMTGATQHHYVHALPKQANCVEERISLTLRRVLGPPHRERGAPE